MTGRHQPVGRPIAPEQLLRILTETVVRIDRAAGLHAAALVLAESTAQHLGADLGGVTLHARRGVPQRLAATDAVLVELDGGEQTGSSPLADPLDEGAAVLVRETSSEPRWPEWAARAHALGIRSALLTGIPAPRGGAVTLELYARHGEGFPRIDPAVAAQLVTVVGIALQHADRTSNLVEALRTRGLVGQAQGILMERFDLDGVQAMSYLRRRSQHSQLPVRDLAAAIVAEGERRRTGADPED